MEDKLTPGQRRILIAYTTCLSYRAVANRLGVQHGTVKNQIQSAFNALGAEGLVDAYVKLGWLRPPVAQ